MPSQHERIDFAPPPPQGQIRAFGLALLAHALLIIGLSVTLHWKRDAEDAAVEAELWSSTVMQAAPRPQPTPPTPTPDPTPTPPAPVVKPPDPTPAPQTRDADIALDKLRKQREAEKKAQQQLELQKKQAAEQARLDKIAKDKADKDKRDKAEKAAADKKAADDKRDQQQAKAAEEKRRQDNIRRAMAMAGSGSPDATGNAQQSSGPSAGYAARLAAIFKRNVNYADPESINGNPKAVIEVRVGPSGSIMSSRLIKSSGVPAWDDAVLRAVQKTDRIPADNGRYPTVFPVEFGPKDKDN